MNINEIESVVGEIRRLFDWRKKIRSAQQLEACGTLPYDEMLGRIESNILQLFIGVVKCGDDCNGAAEVVINRAGKVLGYKHDNG
jgi:hypothetical protein